MVRYEGAKMSKSLGNLVLVGQAVERAPAAAVRLYLASHRYRARLGFQLVGFGARRSAGGRVCARFWRRKLGGRASDHPRWW